MPARRHGRPDPPTPAPPEHRRITGSHCGAILPSIHHQLRLRSGSGRARARARAREEIRSRCGARFLGARDVIGKYERVADAALRHPDVGADGAVGPPPSRSWRMAATVSAVSFDLRLGPLLRRAARPPGLGEPVSQRRTVAGVTANASATSSWVAALIRISDTAANRRAARRRRPRLGQIAVHEHPPARVVLDDRRGRADRTAPSSVSGRGGCAVITAIIHRPTVRLTSQYLLLSTAAGAAHTTHREIRRSQHRITDRAQAPCQESC